MGIPDTNLHGGLRPLGDHWYSWAGDGLPFEAELRVHAAVQADGRLHLDALEYDGPVSASLLRTIPVGRIEAAVNSFARHGHDSERGWADAKIPEHLRETAVRGYPDDFYEAVARAYRLLAANSARPVGVIAEANEVPMTTAQRWVKEARRRGLLPPGRKGKTG